MTCLKRLKSEFADIKVGGPALCGMDESYFTDLLKACRAADVAPDFISWHYYGNGVNEILETVDRARKMCDELGFGDCNLVLNEWHYLGCSWGELRIIDQARDLEPIAVQRMGNRLVLPKCDRESSSYLVVF